MKGKNSWVFFAAIVPIVIMLASMFKGFSVESLNSPKWGFVLIAIILVILSMRSLSDILAGERNFKNYFLVGAGVIVWGPLTLSSLLELIG